MSEAYEKLGHDSNMFEKMPDSANTSALVQIGRKNGKCGALNEVVPSAFVTDNELLGEWGRSDRWYNLGGARRRRGAWATRSSSRSRAA